MLQRKSNKALRPCVENNAALQPKIIRDAEGTKYITAHALDSFNSNNDQ